jgi:hypothetical protein
MLNKRENLQPGDSIELPPAQTAHEQRREFFGQQIREARMLLGMQKELTEEQKKGLLAGTERSLNNYLDYEEIKKRSGLSEDDMKFLTSAENPYNFMAMSVREKEKLYKLQAEVQEIKELMREEELESAKVATDTQ